MSSEQSKSVENVTEELDNKPLNVENATAHLEDQPTPSLFNSVNNSTNEDIVTMDSEIEQSTKEVLDTFDTISNKNYDKDVIEIVDELALPSDSANGNKSLQNEPIEMLDKDMKDTDSNVTIKENQPLADKIPLQQCDVENELKSEASAAEQKLISEKLVNNDMKAEGRCVKPQECEKIEPNSATSHDNDNLMISSRLPLKEVTIYSVDSRSVSSSIGTPGKDLETGAEDDKFKLIWEDDDDDDECENMSATTHNKILSDVKDDTEVVTKSSFLPSREHGLNKPDVMLEIPMQDLGEFSDDNDDCDQEVCVAMSPDVDTGLDKLDKSNTFHDKQSIELKATENDLKSGSQNTSSFEYVSKETLSTNQEQLDTLIVEEDGESFAERNKISPLPNAQIEMDTKLERKLTTDKNKVEKGSEEVEIMDTNHDLLEVKCDKKDEMETQKEDSEPQPSTSALSEDNTIDNMPQNPDVEEMSDSLGLLAESSRVMDDDEQEEDQDEDGDDDDSDADDDNGNQTTAEHSEDSNAQHTEVDSKEGNNDTPTTSDKETSEDGMNFGDAVPNTVELNIDDICIEEATVGDTQGEDIDINEVNEEQNGEDDADINAVDERNVKDDEDINAVYEVNGEDDADAVDKVNGEDDADVNEIDENNAEDYADSNEEVTLQQAEDIEESNDVETVKLSDTSDTEMDEKNETNNLGVETNETPDDDACMDAKVKKGTNKNVVHCVYLEASSSDEEVCEVEQNESESTTVKMPADIDVISSSAGATSDIVMKDTETVISGLPKPPPLKPARINTSEVSIKTTHSTKEAITPPDQSSDPVVNLDSDDEEREKTTETDSPLEEEKVVAGIRCVNRKCSQNPSAQYSIADSRTVAFFDGDKKKRSYVCEYCYDSVYQKNQELIEDIMDFKPLLDLDFGNCHEDLVEISDSESEEETEPVKDRGDVIGDEAARFLEDNLPDIFNDVWTKYRMDERLEDTQEQLENELQRLQKESLEIDELFKQCQSANDKLRKELYATFEPEIHHLPALDIADDDEPAAAVEQADSQTQMIPVAPLPENDEYKDFPMPTKRPRRSTVAWWEPPTKKQAIPMGYAPISNTEATPGKGDDDNTDISVVKLSLEAAPADLPPPGPLTRAPLRAGMVVYAKKKASWLRAVITEILPTKCLSNSDQFTMCRVKFERKNKDPYSLVSGRHLAYNTPADTRMIIGTRVIALFVGLKEYYSAGIVAEVPNPVNNYRYLIFFDDGYAQYAVHADTRVVCQSSPLVWEEVHADSRQFVKDYITSYPERPMVRLHAGQNLKTEFKGKWLSCVVEAVDASLVRVAFADGRHEWIYRGSTRLAPLFLELQAAERSRPRAAPRAMPRPLHNKSNMPYVEYTRSNEQAKGADTRAQNAEELRRQRSVAKKSTTASQPPPAPATNLDDVTSRVVFYTPKNAVKPHKMTPHKCGPQCRRTDVLQLKDLRTYNPLAKPLLSGWERQVVRWRGHKEVMYVGGCGRRLRNMAELHRYLRITRSDMSVDLFDFSPHTHCLAEFVLNRCIVSKKDLSNGKENVPVPCVNYYDHSLPEFYSYNTERTPTAGVPLNLDPDFLCGCDCEDDCQDKSKCACWQLTLEGARTIHMEGDVGYVYKRLPKPVPSGIYECNSRCKCKHTCLNRVAQHPLQLKLQVFKTLNKGWGIRALNDVPEGSFLCVYAGNLLTDATATLDGLNEGDEFLAELDYIEVVEQMKEGYEEDIPEDAKEDKDEASESGSEEEESEEEDTTKEKDDEDDVDFQPGYIGPGLTDFTKRLRKREKKNTRSKDKDKKENDKNQKNQDKAEKKEDDCITISDDESREPSCFTAAAGMRANEFVSKYKSVRTLYGEDEACYIMDAKVQGNIGRYLNHSCTPNVFVQNVFVDTHDPRFPWVAFFALSHVRAGTELTWNYNYDVGSVPGKVLYCLCGAPNCKGRLL